MSKIITYSLLALFLYPVIQAQEEEKKTGRRQVFTLAAAPGLSRASQLFSTDRSFTSTLGLVFEYKRIRAKKWFVSYALRYDQLSFSVDNLIDISNAINSQGDIDENKFETYKARNSYRFVGLAGSFNYRLYQSDKLEVGAKVGLLLKHYLTLKAVHKLSNGERASVINLNQVKEFNPLGQMFIGGAWLEYKFHSNWSLHFNLNYERDILGEGVPPAFSKITFRIGSSFWL